MGAKLLRAWPLVGNSPLSVLDVIRPEVCLYIGLLVLTRVSISLSDTEWVKMFLALAWVPIFVLCSFAELVGQFMFMSTGNHLDAPVLGYALLHFVAVWVVLQSELSLSSGILLFLPPALLIWIYQARPWLELNAKRRGSRWVGAAVFGGIAVVLAYPLPGYMTGDAAGRPVPLELVRTALRASELPKVSVDTLEGWSDAVLLPSTRPSVAKNVAVISLESVGYNATSLAGMYDVTPNLLALSKQSLVAHQAWVVVSHSTKANVAIFCGIDPYLGQTVLEATHLPAQCLPRLLNEQGYASLMLSSATRKFENLTGLIQNTGFQQYLAYEDLDTTGFEAVNYFGVEDDVMIEPAREWLTQQGDTPFFISYMTGAPHHDYQVPSRFEMQRIVEDDTHNRYLNWFGTWTDSLERSSNCIKNSVFMTTRFLSSLVTTEKHLASMATICMMPCRIRRCFTCRCSYTFRERLKAESMFITPRLNWTSCPRLPTP